MANILNKFPENVPGSYYVDKQCIDCDMCRQTVPNVFKRKSIGGYGYSYVDQQPSTPLDLKLTQDAMEACPVEAIGKVDSVVEEEIAVAETESLGSSEIESPLVR